MLAFFLPHDSSPDALTLSVPPARLPLACRFLIFPDCRQNGCRILLARGRFAFPVQTPMVLSSR